MLRNLKFGALLVAILSMILTSVNASEIYFEIESSNATVVELEEMEESEELEDNLAQINEEMETVLWDYRYQDIHFLTHACAYRLDLPIDLRPPRFS